VTLKTMWALFNTISSVNTITLYMYLILMLEWSLMGHLMSRWVGVAGSYCFGSMCQYYAC
jgi:hypothetical protein